MLKRKLDIIETTQTKSSYSPKNKNLGGVYKNQDFFLINKFINNNSLLYLNAHRVFTKIASCTNIIFTPIEGEIDPNTNFTNNIFPFESYLIVNYGEINQNINSNINLNYVDYIKVLENVNVKLVLYDHKLLLDFNENMSIIEDFILNEKKIFSPELLNDVTIALDELSKMINKMQYFFEIVKYYVSPRLTIKIFLLFELLLDLLRNKLSIVTNVDFTLISKLIQFRKTFIDCDNTDVDTKLALLILSLYNNPNMNSESCFNLFNITHNPNLCCWNKVLYTTKSKKFQKILEIDAKILSILIYKSREINEQNKLLKLLLPFQSLLIACEDNKWCNDNNNNNNYHTTTNKNLLRQCEELFLTVISRINLNNISNDVIFERAIIFDSLRVVQLILTKNECENVIFDTNKLLIYALQIVSSIDLTFNGHFKTQHYSPKNFLKNISIQHIINANKSSIKLKNTNITEIYYQQIHVTIKLLIKNVYISIKSNNENNKFDTNYFENLLRLILVITNIKLHPQHNYHRYHIKFIITIINIFLLHMNDSSTKQFLNIGDSILAVKIMDSVSLLFEYLKNVLSKINNKVVHRLTFKLFELITIMRSKISYSTSNYQSILREVNFISPKNSNYYFNYNAYFEHCANYGCITQILEYYLSFKLSFLNFYTKTPYLHFENSRDSLDSYLYVDQEKILQILNNSGVSNAIFLKCEKMLMLYKLKNKILLNKKFLN